MLLTVAVKACVALVNSAAVAGATVMLTGKVTVTVACAVLVLSALLVAVTAQLPAVVGAVNVTGFAVVLESFPQLALQATEVLVVWPTVAENTCAPLVFKLAVAGATEMVTGAVTVTVALALFIISALLCAVTVQLPADAGAVNITGFDVALDTNPQLAVHVTAVFAVLVTVAAKACVPLVSKFAGAGVTAMATGAFTVTVAWAVFVLSALLDAVTVHVPAVAGTVNVTGLVLVLDSLPQLALQVTATFVVPVTVALIAVVCDSVTVTDAGETDMVTVAAERTLEPAKSTARTETTAQILGRASRRSGLEKSSSNRIKYLPRTHLYRDGNRDGEVYRVIG